MSDLTGFRVEQLRNKLPLLTGGLDKLGILPILATLVIQFKDMHWPPQASWPEVFLFALLMGVYWQSLLQVGARFRLELYDVLPKKRSQRDADLYDRGDDRDFEALLKFGQRIRVSHAFRPLLEARLGQPL